MGTSIGHAFVLRRLAPLSAASAILFPLPASAQVNSDDEVVEEIVVTGSRIKRRDLTAPSPISTLDQIDFEAAPQPTLEETLNQMPQLLPDMSRSVNNGSTGQANLNLRGLGSERTLVLLNGRRQAPSGVSSTVDINNIPQILIDRVEIITGGASAVYGSDALAGVVNFITRDDFEGFNADLGYGITQEGDAGYQDINLAWGSNLAGGRGNVVVYGGFFEREALYGDARKLTRDVWIDNWDTGELLIGGAFGTPASEIYGPEIDWNIDPEYPYTTFNADGTPRGFVYPDDLYNWQAVNYVQTPLTRWNAGVMGTLEVGKGFELYLETAFTNNESSVELAAPVQFIPVEVNTDNPVLTPETSQLLIDHAGGPGVVDIFIGHRFLGAGPRHIDYDKDYWRTVLGMRGEIWSGWELDGWVSYTKSEESQLLLNSGSLQRFRQGLLVDPATGQCFDPSGGCVPIDIFGPGRVSEEAGEFLRYPPLLNETSRTQKLASVYVTGSPFNSWAGPVDIAAGLDWRSDDVSFRADDVLFTSDAIGYVPDAPVEGKETVTEIYAEAIVPLLIGSVGADYLGIEVGGRYSKYDYAGGVWTYKAGGTWEPAESLRFRAMWQRSVRAPNNLELFQAQFVEGSFFSSTNNPDPCSASQDPVGNGNAERCIIQGLPADQIGVFEAEPFYPADYINGGNPELEPEEARTMTIGLTYTPELLPSWSFAIDYYQMDVDGEIGNVSVQDVCFDSANVNNVFCDKIQRDSTGNVVEVEEIVRNRGFLSTKGIDAQINFTTDLPDSLSLFGAAQFEMQIVWTHMLEIINQENPVTTRIPCEGYFGTPCAWGNTTFAEDRIATNFSYLSGPFSAVLTSRWISGVDNWGKVDHLYFDAPPANVAIPSVGSHHYLNLNLSYDFSDSVFASVGIANLLDKGPPMMANNAFANNTDSTLYDIYGRMFTFRVGVQLGN